MALPILDGNQSATTLSTILSGGEHTPAHTVVSLGSTAISNITSAVSGSVVSISNFPSTQTIAGTVTANVGGIASGVTVPVRLYAEQLGGAPSGQDTLVVCDSGGKLLINAVAGPDASVLGYDGSAFVQVKQVAGSSVTIGSLPAISGTVTVGNTVTVAGTVTANLPTSGAYGGSLQGYNGTNTYLNVGIQNVGSTSLNGGNSLPVSGTVTIGSLPAISGTVTANVFGLWSGDNGAYQVPVIPGGEYNNGTRVAVSLVNSQGSVIGSGFDGGESLDISGTVTVGAMPNGSLTTRFGTPTTANVSFATTAVTNANRKYLLIQNVTTGSNVITVGIGFTPTTTQGIQLTAGAGITFESSYIPTGAVMILSSVTASNFTILEA